MVYEMPSSEPIALVGSACRFAGPIRSPRDLWEVTSSLPIPDLSETVPDARFNIGGFFHPNAEHHGTTNSPKAYFLGQDHRVFDASFFNITPKEAEAIDPQQRLLLEVTFEALESAGYTLQQYAGQNVAVYVGTMTGDYDTLSARDELNASQYAPTGNARSILSNRVSYFFDFHGPSMTIDTACSSSLVALHQAVQSLRSKESPMACVAGVNMLLTPEQFISESKLHMISPTGNCRMWDENADGYARGEGIAAFFIKTLSQALADGDQIEAIIRETAVNSDGRSQGITRPSHKAQTALIRETYRKAGLNPMNPAHHPHFFEAHGTGTPVGDPIEARAISEAFFHQPPDHRGADDIDPVRYKLPVGSIKTIIGHTEGAAGLAGVLKVVQSLNNDWIIPNLHLNSINPQVLPFYGNLIVVTKPTSWMKPAAGQPRRASVNSFGFGGTNCHIIVEKYQPNIHNPMAQPRSGNTSIVISRPLDISWGNLKEVKIALPLVFSAASPKSLTAKLEQYAVFSKNDANNSPALLAWHLFKHQTTHDIRKLVLLEDDKAFDTAISSAAVASEKMEGVVRVRKVHGGSSPKLLGIFTGQGAQYASMSRGLFQLNSVYRSTIETLDRVLQTCPDPPSWSLLDELMKGPEDSLIHTSEKSQVLCCALQVGLVDFLYSIGVTFACVLGHSSGEIVAAYAAGRIKQRDAILVSYYRGKYAYLAEGNNGAKGGMAACGMSKARAEEFCSSPDYRGRLVLAASNSPGLVTISGDLEAIEQAVVDLKKNGIFVRQLMVDTAYHSFHMRRVVQEYSKSLLSCGIETSLGGNGTRWISTLSSQELLASDGLEIGYWGENMLNPVLFHEAVNMAMQNYGRFDCVVEVGPHPALKSPLKDIFRGIDHTDLFYTGLLDRTREDRMALAEFLGVMWASLGPSSIDIERYIRDSPNSEILNHRFGTNQLPTYPWDHSKVHWRESRLSEQYHFRQQPPHELLGVRTRDDSSYEMRWRNVLTLDNIPWASGHKFQGQALLPASAYCVMAFDAAKVLLADHSKASAVIELSDLKFVSGITIENDSLGIETLFTLKITSSGNHNNISAREGQLITAGFTLTSAPVKSHSSGRFPVMMRNFEGHLSIVILAAPSLPPSVGLERRAETLPVKIDAFYKMMDGIGLSYTGPFRALKSLNRRLNYAAATLDMIHPSDTTTLSISPATLDSCFQANFTTYSSPGDKALWTSFLPSSIAKIRLFNHQRTLAVPSTLSEISVEAYLTNINPYTHSSAASVTTDISIYGLDKAVWIEVEGLNVTTFAPTKPENDYELYLHTVFDVDPEDEIVVADPPSSAEISELPETCQLVYRHSINKIQSAESDSSRPGSHHSQFGEMDQLIRGSRISSALHHIRETCSDSLSDLLPNALDLAIQEAKHLLQLQKHLGRIMGQIAHRYPRMNILGLTDPKVSLQESILCGLRKSFRSYRIGQGIEGSLATRIPDLNQKKVVLDEFDIEELHGESSPNSELYDMVVISTTVLRQNHQTHWTPLHALKRIRNTIKDGGILLLINTSPSHSQLEATSTSQGEQDIEVLPHWGVWSGWLEQSGFVFRARNSDQRIAKGFSLSVRQARSTFKDSMWRPLKWEPQHVVAEHLLIIGGISDHVLKLSTEIARSFSTHCSKLSRAIVLDQVKPDNATTCTVVVMLIDLERPVATTMDVDQLNVLKRLMRPDIIILWVTKNTGLDPERAACLGLTRSLKPEVPNLTLQVLDLELEDMETCHKLITETLAQLIHSKEFLHQVKPGTLLWSEEPEIHTHNGRLMVPRVVPYEPANARLNTYRRPVNQKVHTAEYRLKLQCLANPDGSIRYEESDSEQMDLRCGQEGDGSLISILVNYSSSWAMRLDDGNTLYLCAGKDLQSQSDHTTIGLASEQASIVRIHEPFVRRLPLTTGLRVTEVVAVLSKVLFAMHIVDSTRARNLVVVDSDEMLVHCLELVSKAQDCPSTNLNLHVWTTDETLPERNRRFTYVHPWSNSRVIKTLLPESRTVWAFMPRNTHLWKTLEAVSPDSRHGYDYCKMNNISASKACSSTKLSQRMAENWNRAVTMSLEIVESGKLVAGAIDSITPSRLLETSENSGVYPFTLIDWKTDRWVTLPVKPHRRKNVLRDDRTYILVGLTRDLGQSLCRLFVQQGAQHIVVASRNPDPKAAWIAELNLHGANIRAVTLDVTRFEAVKHLKYRMNELSLPPVGGVVNGAMVLEDKVFTNIDIASWKRVMGPKVTGSRNLDMVFGDDQLEFFIMTSSFAAIGGHAGQTSYATANMYMNGLAANRRRRGLCGSVLNIGVIYGLGLLARERQHIYNALERDGYPPISERDIHHMFLEAIEAGRPVSGQIMDLTTGLARYQIGDPNPQHWHLDERFSHFTKDEQNDPVAPADGSGASASVQALIQQAKCLEDIVSVVQSTLCSRMDSILQLPGGSVRPDSSIAELGVDSLAAVDIRQWFYKVVGQNVAVMKILGASSIANLCQEVAADIGSGGGMKEVN